MTKDIKFCIKCGASLDLTNFNAYWCPNCGKLLENQDIPTKEDDSKQTYIG